MEQHDGATEMAGSRRFKPTKRRGLLCNLKRRSPIRIVDSQSEAVIVLTFDRQGKLNIDAPQRFLIEKSLDAGGSIGND